MKKETYNDIAAFLSVFGLLVLFGNLIYFDWMDCLNDNLNWTCDLPQGSFWPSSWLGWLAGIIVVVESVFIYRYFWYKFDKKKAMGEKFISIICSIFWYPVFLGFSFIIKTLWFVLKQVSITFEDVKEFAVIVLIFVLVAFALFTYFWLNERLIGWLNKKNKKKRKVMKR